MFGPDFRSPFLDFPPSLLGDFPVLFGGQLSPCLFLTFPLLFSGKGFSPFFFSATYVTEYLALPLNKNVQTRPFKNHSGRETPPIPGSFFAWGGGHPHV